MVTWDPYLTMSEGDDLAMFTPPQEKMVSLGVSVSSRVSGDEAVKPRVEKRMFTWGTGLSSVVDILRMVIN